MTPDEPSDPPVQHARTARGPFAYTDEGAGPVLVALHGLPGSVRDFRWLAPELQGIRLVRLDQPGFGDTPLATEPSVRLQRRGAWVHEALDALGIDACIVLGHSFGGGLASEVAASRPERVRGLVLLASIGVRWHRGRRSFRWWPVLSVGLRLPVIGPPLLRRAREAYVEAGFPKRLSDEAIANTAHRVAWLSLERHKQNLASLRIPTLVAWTEDDHLVEKAISEELYWACPHGPRLAFPDGGHNLQKTRAVELGEALTAWVPGV